MVSPGVAGVKQEGALQRRWPRAAGAMGKNVCMWWAKPNCLRLSRRKRMRHLAFPFKDFHSKNAEEFAVELRAA